ncbi:MAG: hypothetical protein ACQEQU_06355 [Spirochaetota bacterium]
MTAETLLLGMAADVSILLFVYVVWKLIRYSRRRDKSAAYPWLKSRGLQNILSGEAIDNLPEVSEFSFERGSES